MGTTMITIDELIDLNPEITLLRVRSFDPEVYLVEVEFNERCHAVADKLGELLKFRGLSMAKRAFTGLHIKAAELVHESAFDEMIGQPMSEGNHMKVRISVPD